MGVAEAEGGELFGDGEEVGECVHLLLHLAGVVPGVAEVGSTADVGVGHDDAAVEQREARGREAYGEWVAVRAVAVDVERIFGVAVEAVAAVDDGDGDLYLIGCGDPYALGGVARGVEVAGDLLLFQELGFAHGNGVVRRGDIVLVDGGG